MLRRTGNPTQSGIGSRCGARTMKHAQAVAAVRELCSLGLPSELFVPALLEAMHAVIPSSRNLFDWIDSGGRIERYYFEGAIDSRIAKLYFDEFYNRRESEAMPRFSDVALGGSVIRGARELDRTSFYDSALYNEIWRPQDLHYHLEAIIRRADGKALGSMVLYREKTDPIFTREEEALLATLVPYIARAMQLQTKRREHVQEQFVGSRRRALVNMDPHGRILHLSRDAHKLLLLAHGNITPRAVGVEPCAEDFPTLTVLCRTLARSTDAPRPVLATLDNDWGRFEFHALSMEPAGAEQAPMIAVTIQHMEPTEVFKARALQSAPLSITQKKVCALLLGGLSQRDIAAHLGVAPSTVVDHVRKIYVRLDVHSLDDLRERLLHA
jgi:DNA-binding CsgD family transcriptional regulator